MTLALHNGDLNKLTRNTSHDSIVLKVGEQEIVTLKSNGEIYVKGKRKRVAFEKDGVK